jgi:hypothetical protein
MLSWAVPAQTGVRRGIAVGRPEHTFTGRITFLRRAIVAGRLLLAHSRTFSQPEP